MNFYFMLFSFDSASLAAVFILVSPLEKDEPESFNSVKYNIMPLKREAGARFEITSQLKKKSLMGIVALLYFD